MARFQRSTTLGGVPATPSNRRGRGRDIDAQSPPPASPSPLGSAVSRSGGDCRGRPMERSVRTGLQEIQGLDQSFVWLCAASVFFAKDRVPVILQVVVLLFAEPADCAPRHHVKAEPLGYIAREVVCP